MSGHCQVAVVTAFLCQFNQVSEPRRNRGATWKERNTDQPGVFSSPQYKQQHWKYAMKVMLCQFRVITVQVVCANESCWTSQSLHSGSFACKSPVAERAFVKLLSEAELITWDTSLLSCTAYFSSQKDFRSIFKCFGVNMRQFMTSRPKCCFLFQNRWAKSNHLQTGISPSSKSTDWFDAVHSGCCRFLPFEQKETIQPLFSVLKPSTDPFLT